MALLLRDGDRLPAQVAGECMAPLLNHGDRIVLVRQAWYWPGDVLAFADHNGALLVHRFLGWVPRRGTLQAMTRADTGPRIDVLVDRERILGRAVMCEQARIVIGLRARVRALRVYCSTVLQLCLRRLSAGLR